MFYIGGVYYSVGGPFASLVGGDVGVELGEEVCHVFQLVMGFCWGQELPRAVASDWPIFSVVVRGGFLRGVMGELKVLEREVRFKGS